MNTTQNNNINYGSFSTDEVADLLQERLAAIQESVSENGYQCKGEFPDREVIRERLRETSHCMNKRLIKWHYRLKHRFAMRSANLFLHVLCRKLLEYGPEQAVPRIDFSEKELAIKAARKAWVAARDEAERLRLAYVEEKGDFYRR